MKVLGYDSEKVIKDMTIEMREKRITQQQLSKETGVDSTTISKFLRKKYYPSLDNVMKLLTYLGKDVREYTSTGTITVIARGRKMKYEDYEQLSIDELDGLIKQLIKIRQNKLDEAINSLVEQQKELEELKTKYEDLV